VNRLPCQDAELKAKKNGAKPSKNAVKLWCENYESKYGIFKLRFEG
jgi:hypothetical protein